MAANKIAKGCHLSFYQTAKTTLVNVVLAATTINKSTRLFVQLRLLHLTLLGVTKEALACWSVRDSFRSFLLKKRTQATSQLRSVATNVVQRLGLSLLTFFWKESKPYTWSGLKQKTKIKNSNRWIDQHAVAYLWFWKTVVSLAYLYPVSHRKMLYLSESTG